MYKNKQCNSIERCFTFYRVFVMPSLQVFKLYMYIYSKCYCSADDWQCSKCGNVNWARRQQCNMCNAPKFGEIEERTGYGGGYNDRGVVEYKERRDDDDEYDEFGRRKKKRKLEKNSDDDSKDSKYSSPSRSKSRDKEERDKVDEEEQEENVKSLYLKAA